MIVAVINNKGGVGKSTIAYNLALEMGFKFITNEPRSPCVNIFGEDRGFVLNDSADIRELDVSNLDIIFDFKGSTKGKLISSVLSIADYVIVPAIYKHKDDIFVDETIFTISDCEKFNKNIIIIANHIERHVEWEFVCEEMKGLPYPVLRLNKAILLKQTIKSKKGISEFVEGNNLLKANNRAVIQQFGNIINELKRNML